MYEDIHCSNVYEIVAIQAPKEAGAGRASKMTKRSLY